MQITWSHKTVIQQISLANFFIQNLTNKAAIKFGVEIKKITKWIQQLHLMMNILVTS